MKLLIVLIFILGGANGSIKKGDEIIFIEGSQTNGYYKFAKIEETGKPLTPLFSGLKVVVKKVKTRKSGEGKETLLYVTMTSGDERYIVEYEKALDAGEIRVKE